MQLTVLSSIHICTINSIFHWSHEQFPQKLLNLTILSQFTLVYLHYVLLIQGKPGFSEFIRKLCKSQLANGTHSSYSIIHANHDINCWL